MCKLMINTVFLLSLLLLSCNSEHTAEKETVETNEKSTSMEKAEYAIVIHGGAGTITRDRMTDEMEKQYRETLNEVLEQSRRMLAEGSEAYEVVITAIGMMEDSPLFNAGKGAVFTNAGTNELDASIMRGSDLEAGAVGGVSNIKNPIKAAYAVLDKSQHVFLSGKGAEEFADDQGLELVDPKYFYTDNRWNSLQTILDKEEEIGMHITDMADSKFGTVGAVVLDKSGNIVAGTSTGGMTNKKYGRIGDSPVIGAGTYADNKTCGVSCTGHGEYFIRYAVAHDVSAMMAYKGSSLEEACEEIINNKLKNAGGEGGLIALDRWGNVSMPFNTEGMYRGYLTDKEKYIAIYKDE